jgi:NitT/TauT family transport system substrate-binding protein
MKVRTFLTAAVLLAVLSCPLWAGGSSESDKVSGDTGTGVLKIGILPDVDSIPLIMARELGLFREAGAAVELVPFGNPVNRDAALQAGEIDGAVSDLLAAVFARKGGFPLFAVTGTDGSYKLLASGAKGISSLENLENGEVALSRNTIIEYCTDRILAAGGYLPDHIRKVSIPQIPVRLEMLNSGKLDGATLPEPLASAAIARGAVLLGSSDELGINPGVLLFSEEVIRERSGELKALFAACDSAVSWLNAQTSPAAMESIIHAAGFPEGIRDVMVLPHYSPAHLPSEKEVEEVVEWMLSHSLIEERYGYADLVRRPFPME